MYYSNLLLYTTVYQHLSIIFDWYTKVMGPMVTGRSWAPWPSRVYHGFYHVLAMIWPWFICGIAVTCCYPKLDQRHEMSGFLQNRQEKYGQLYLIVKSGKDIQKHLKTWFPMDFPCQLERNRLGLRMAAPCEVRSRRVGRCKRSCNSCSSTRSWGWRKHMMAHGIKHQEDRKRKFCFWWGGWGWRM